MTRLVLEVLREILVDRRCFGPTSNAIVLTVS
jgi:hypothetical protein